MKKVWSTAMGIVLIGLTFLGIRQFINAIHHGKEDTASSNKFNMAHITFFFITVIFIMFLAFSAEIKTFLTQFLLR